MRTCEQGHNGVAYQYGVGCPVCELDQVIASQSMHIQQLEVALRTAAKPSPFKDEYVLGEGYPTREREHPERMWLHRSRGTIGYVELKWPEELGNHSQPDDLPKYQLILKRVPDAEPR